MKQISTLLTSICLFATSFNSFSQTCGTGGSFTPGATTTFNTTAESFSGDFTQTSSGPAGYLVSSAASAGQIKKLVTSTYTLPASATTLYWSFELGGNMNVQSYSVIAYYNSGTSVATVPVCSGGSLGTTGANLIFNATSPSQILGKEFKLEITFTSTTPSSSKTLSVDNFKTSAFNSNIPLPIKLLNFQGSLNSSFAQLQWSVADNETGDNFEIERSLDGKSFNTIALVSTSEKQGTETYSYKDAAQPIAYYRLKINNKNGSVAHSKIITLKTQTTATASNLVIVQNPVEASVMLNYKANQTNKSTINIYTASGARILTTNVNVQQGNNTVSLNLDGKFNSGMYLLEIISGSERSVAKMIKK